MPLDDNAALNRTAPVEPTAYRVGSPDAGVHSAHAVDEVDTAALAAAMNAADATVPQRVAEQLPQISAAIDAIVPRLRSGGRLIYVGAGTSGRLGVLDASECPPTFNTEPEQVTAIIAGGPHAIVNAVEDAEDDTAAGAASVAHVTPNDIVVGIAASGRTPFVAGALTAANDRGALTVALSCVAAAPNSALAAHAIEVNTGAEFLRGSSRLKAGTATKLVVNMLTTISMMQLGKTYGDLMVDVRASNEKLRVRAAGLVVDICAQHGHTLDADAAHTALVANAWRVSPTVISVLTGCSPAVAAEVLAQHDGVLARALTAAGVTACH